jgi:hypothetical protein
VFDAPVVPFKAEAKRLLAEHTLAVRAAASSAGLGAPRSTTTIVTRLTKVPAPVRAAIRYVPASSEPRDAIRPGMRTRFLPACARMLKRPAMRQTGDSWRTTKKTRAAWRSVNVMTVVRRLFGPDLAIQPREERTLFTFAFAAVGLLSPGLELAAPENVPLPDEAALPGEVSLPPRAEPVADATDETEPVTCDGAPTTCAGAAGTGLDTEGTEGTAGTGWVGAGRLGMVGTATGGVGTVGGGGTGTGTGTGTVSARA